MAAGYRIRMTIAAVAASFLFAGCAGTSKHDYAFDIAPTTGMLALDIENFRGNVEVRVDRRIDRAEVFASAAARRPTMKDEKTVLDEMWVNAELIEEGARATLKVRTGSPREDTGDHWVDLLVRLPRCDGLRIDNRNGTVVVVGTSGGTAITNRLGAVEFRTDKAMTDPVTITTTDGDMYYQVPVGSAGAFDIHTLAGSIWYRDRVQGSDKSYNAPGEYRVRLNEGTSPVVLRTNRGDINIWVDEDPVGLTRIMKRELPDVQDYWYLQGSRRHTRNLPEDHPEVTRRQITVNAYHDSY